MGWFLVEMSDQAMIVDDFSRLAMTSQYTDHVNGNQDDEIRCDIPYDIPWPRIEIMSSQVTWSRDEASVTTQILMLR